MLKRDLHYVEPRLVDLYDIENPRCADTDFYVQLAAELDARHILDLGCGTGLFTRELAIDGRQVVGVDPSSALVGNDFRCAAQLSKSVPPYARLL